MGTLPDGCFLFYIRTSLILSLFIDVPAHSRCSEHSGRRTFKTGNEELCLALVDVEDVLFVCLLDRIHNQVACLSEAAEEDESLR